MKPLPKLRRKIRYGPLDCEVCGCEVDPQSSREKHCSWECRLQGILNVFKDPKQCWSWPLSTNKITGYGQFNVGGGHIMAAHRAVYVLTHGYGAAKDLQVCHACDNRSCVNPYHLFGGTAKDNSDDMFAKGRQPKTRRYQRGDEHYSRRHPEKLHRLFTPGVELVIADTSGTTRALAKQFNCSHSTIISIRHRAAGSAKKDVLLQGKGDV